MTIEQDSLTAEPLPITVDQAFSFAVHDVSTGAAVPRAGDRPDGVIRPVREVQPGPGPIAALHGADLPVRDQPEVGERIVTEHRGDIVSRNPHPGCSPPGCPKPTGPARAPAVWCEWSNHVA